MNIYNACMRLFQLLWFSIKLGMINSLLVVCFYNGFKSFQVRIFTKFVQEYYVMAIKQHLWENASNIQSIQEKILPIMVPAIQSTKHFVGQIWFF